MSKILLVYNQYCSFISELEDSGYDHCHYEEIENISEYEYVFDFTFLSLNQKTDLLKKLSNVKKEIHSDLTCYSNKELHQQFPKLMGSFASLFVTEKKKIEYFCQGNRDVVTQILSDINLSPYWYDSFGIGFTYPRILVQIINEAYFALDEKVANKKDIDRAMKYGVNYPKGPFEWSEGKEEIVKTLLIELQKIDHKRYQIAKNL